MLLAWSIFGASAIAVVAFLAAVAVFVERCPWPTRGAWPAARPAPRLSVVIPARNEERVIASCVGSVLRQDYPNLEVIVVDDGSDDGTAEIVEDLVAADPRCRLVRGRPLEPGWLGKCNALDHGVAHATGEYLLFIDADVVVAPGAATAGVLEMERRSLALLSLWPYHTVRGVLASPVQSVVVGFALFADAMQRVFGRRFPEALGVWGPFILVEAAAYAAVGGHATVRGDVNEDQMLGRRFREAGLRTAMLQGTELVSVTMYDDLPALWFGWTKNMFLTLGSSYALAVGAAVMAIAVTCGGLLGGIAGAAAGSLPVVGLSSLVIALQVAAATLVARHVRIAAALALTPIGGLVTAAIVLASAFNAATRRQVRWKGRSVGAAPTL